MLLSRSLEPLMLCGLGRAARVSGVLRGKCRCDQSSVTSSCVASELNRPSSFLAQMLVCYMTLAQFLGPSTFFQTLVHYNQAKFRKNHRSATLEASFATPAP